MRRLATGLALAALLSACGGSGASSLPGPRTVTVFAAASLTKAFGAEAKAFTSSHPGVQVALSFAGSQSLVAQIEQGAPASVLATADLVTAQSVRDRLQGDPVVFAHNQLALVTPVGNPAHVRTLADLARPGVTVVLAAPTVPVGKASAAALRRAGVTVSPVSLEDAVTGVVTKVRLGEADAGIAYVTDLVRAEGIEGTPLPGTTTDLAIAVVSGDAHPTDAEAFLAFVRSPQGQAILRAHGFR